MKHTPGPWHIARYESGPTDNPKAWSGWHIGTGTGRSVGPPDVAYVDDVDYGPEIAEANAKLIAAAPELLEALKREFAHSACICHILRRCAEKDTDDTVCDHCKTKAVLDKVEGGS